MAARKRGSTKIEKQQRSGHDHAKACSPPKIKQDVPNDLRPFNRRPNRDRRKLEETPAEKQHSYKHEAEHGRQKPQLSFDRQ
jgi:hypothetical protein